MTIASSDFHLKEFFSSQQFAELPDDGNRYDLINGRLVKMPPTGDEHGYIAGELYSEIKGFAKKHGLGQAWFTTGFVLSENSTLEPDVAFVVASRVPPRSKKALAVVPDLVIEIHSPSDLRSPRERENAEAKIKVYQTAGVKIIWAVNPAAQTVEVYHSDSDGPAKLLTIEDRLEGEDILPGFELPVKSLFE